MSKKDQNRSGSPTRGSGSRSRGTSLTPPSSGRVSRGGRSQKTPPEPSRRGRGRGARSSGRGRGRGAVSRSRSPVREPEEEADHAEEELGQRDEERSEHDGESEQEEPSRGEDEEYADHAEEELEQSDEELSEHDGESGQEEPSRGEDEESEQELDLDDPLDQTFQPAEEDRSPPVRGRQSGSVTSRGRRAEASRSGRAGRDELNNNTPKRGRSPLSATERRGGEKSARKSKDMTVSSLLGFRCCSIKMLAMLEVGTSILVLTRVGTCYLKLT